MRHRTLLAAVLAVIAGGLPGLIPPATAGTATYYFPHVADGGDGSLYYTSEFLLNNVQSTPTVVTLSFFTDTGAPWLVELQSLDRADVTGGRTVFTFTLQPNETANLYTGAAGRLAAGWASVQSSQPLVVTSNFTLYRAGSPAKLLWQAGVLPAPPSTLTSFEANVSKVRDVFTGVAADTGFGIANPSAADAVVTVNLVPRWGGAPVGVQTVDVPRSGHRAMFLSELFQDVFWGDSFHGTLRFSSNVGVSIVALKRSYGGGNDLYSTVAAQPDTELKRNIVYDTEHNSSFALAQPVSVPVEIVGTSNFPDDASDADYFAVTVLAGQTIHVILLAEMIGSPMDAVLTLYDPERILVAEADNAAPNVRDPVLTYTINHGGTYFIRCSTADGKSSRGTHYRMFVLVKQ